MTLLFAVILLGVVIICVLAPLFAREAAAEGGLAADVTPAVHLEEQRKVIYENVEDLEFEYQAGKLSEEDYQRTRQDYMTEAGGLMAQELDLPSKAPAHKRAGEGSAVSHREIAPSFCPQCGIPTPREAKFCADCGTRLTLPSG